MVKFARSSLMKFFLRSLVLLGFSVMVQAQEPKVRRLSLEDCMQLALEKNLDIRIQRYLPDFARLDLDGAYSAYDPQFAFRAGQRFSTFEQGFDPSEFNPPSQENWRDSYSTGLTGLTPWGLRYNFFGTMDRSRSQTETTNNIVLKGPFDYTPA